MARTHRQRKLDKRRRRDAEREIARRFVEGEHVVNVVIVGGSKTRPAIPKLGRSPEPDSPFARRLADARAALEALRRRA